MPLDDLRARERLKRRLALGAIVTLYAVCWLFFAWRASRIAETECTVIRISGSCALGHVLDGRQYSLPYDDCTKTMRWQPRGATPAPVGSKHRCFYYLNFPDDIFLEARSHR